MSARILLGAMCDTLVPGDDVYPSASAAGILDGLADHARFSETLTGLADLLPADFAAMDETQRVAALERLESSRPDLFGAAVVAVYSLYYTRQPVLDTIEATNGYSARPPQPEGYALKPFDPAFVAVPAARPAHYRPTPAPTPGAEDAH